MDNHCLVILNTEVRLVMKGKYDLDGHWRRKKKKIHREPVLFLSVPGMVITWEFCFSVKLVYIQVLNHN